MYFEATDSQIITQKCFFVIRRKSIAICSLFFIYFECRMWAVHCASLHLKYNSLIYFFKKIKSDIEIINL